MILRAKIFHLWYIFICLSFQSLSFLPEFQVFTVHLELACYFSVSCHQHFNMTSFYNKSYKRVSASNFLDSSPDEEEENRRTSVQTKKSLIFDSSTTCVLTTTSSATSTLPSSWSTSQMKNQSLERERSGKTKFNRSTSDFDISVHSA